MKSVVWDNFTKGEDRSSAKGQVPPGFSRRVVGFFVDDLGTLRYQGSSPTLFGSVNPLAALHRYSDNALIYVEGASSPYDIMRFDDTLLTYTAMGTATGSNAVSFAQHRERVYATHGTSGALQVSEGLAAFATAGIAAPASSPTPALDAGSTLALYSRTPPYSYEYWQTFVNARGAESNPSPVSAAVIASPTGQEYIEVTLNALTGGAVSSRVYRRGGAVKKRLLVGTWAHPAGNNVFIDNIADRDQTTRELSSNNGTPPTGMDGIFIHRQRLFGFSFTGAGQTISSSHLWFSGLSQYETFGRNASGAKTDGGYLELPGNAGDGILALSSTGSLLVIGRRRSVWVLFGNSFADFSFSQRSNTGVYNPSCMVRGGNHVYFLGTDRRIYRVSNDGVDRLSTPVDKYLREYLADGAALPAPLLSFVDDKLIIQFYNVLLSHTSDPALILDLNTGAFVESYELNAPVSVHVGQEPDSSLDRLYFSSEDENSPGDFLIRRAFAGTLGETQVLWESGELIELDGDGGQCDISIEFLHVEGTGLVHGSTPLKLQLVADNGNTRDFALLAGSGELLKTRLTGFVSPFVTLRLTGEITAGAIRRIICGYSIARTREMR
jgi:hypothetical protein